MSSKNQAFELDQDCSTIDNRDKKWENDLQLFRGYDNTIRFLNGYLKNLENFSNNIRQKYEEKSPFRQVGVGPVYHAARIREADSFRHVDISEISLLKEVNLEKGEIYDLTFSEVVSNGSDKWLTGNNLNDIEENINLLTVHTQIYCAPEGSEHYLVHWDPGISVPKRENGTDKKKLNQSKENSIGLDIVQSNEGTEFIDNSTYLIEEGLNVITTTLENLANRFWDTEGDIDRYFEIGEYADERHTSLVENMDWIPEEYELNTESDVRTFENDIYTDLTEDLEFSDYSRNWTPFNSNSLDTEESRIEEQDFCSNYEDDLPVRSSIEMDWNALRWRAINNSIKFFLDSYKQNKIQGLEKN